MVRRILIVTLLGFSFVASPALGADRVDFFSPDGKRERYAIVERTTGRVDFYDNASRRTGYGKLTERATATT